MQVDPVDPYGVIYVQLVNRDIYKWNGSGWTKIMDLATARAWIGGVYDNGNANFGFIAANKAESHAGHIYVMFGSGPATGGGIKVLRSVDYGENWTYHAYYDAITASPTAWVSAYGNDIFMSHGHGSNKLLGRSSDNGSSTPYFYTIWGIGGSGDQINIDPTEVDKVYYYDYYDSALHRYTVSPNATTQLQGSITDLSLVYSNLAAYADFAGAQWFDRQANGHQRILADGKLYVTYDEWATIEEATPTDWNFTVFNGVKVSNIASPKENVDYILIGLSEPSEAGKPRLFAKLGEDTSEAPWHVAGTNHNTSPYTGALPSVAGMEVATYGIYVGAGMASSGVYVYANEQGDITNIPDANGLGTPLFGDRGSWRDLPADGYDIYHAEDVNAATPQIHAPWDEASPPAAGYGIVSDGNKWEVSSDEIALVSDLHDAVTLDADAATILDLSTQEIGLDTQTANTVLAGPTTGAADEPTFRALVEADLPATTIVESEAHEHIINEDHSSECDGIVDTFALQVAFRYKSTQVYLSGLRQIFGVDYDEVADSIVFVTPPAISDTLTVDYITTYAAYVAFGSLLLSSGDYLLLEDGDNIFTE
jgi:hypothetical protein